MPILITVLVVLCIVALIAGFGAFVAWHRERLRSRLLAERLLVEGRIEALTVQTLQAMREATRQRWPSRGSSHDGGGPNASL